MIIRELISWETHNKIATWYLLESIKRNNPEKFALWLEEIKNR
jgi:hypothetical protein